MTTEDLSWLWTSCNLRLEGEGGKRKRKRDGKKKFEKEVVTEDEEGKLLR